MLSELLLLLLYWLLWFQSLLLIILCIIVVDEWSSKAHWGPYWVWVDWVLVVCVGWTKSLLCQTQLLLQLSWDFDNNQYTYFSFYDTTRPAQQKILADPIFNELLVPIHNSSKRASWDFYAMIKCGTGCNPLVYKGYGCYCGFLGSGDTVDGIDRYWDSSWPPWACSWCWGAARCMTGATPPPPAWSCSTTCPTSSPTSGSVMEVLPTAWLARPSPPVGEAAATRY